MREAISLVFIRANTSELPKTSWLLLEHIGTQLVSQMVSTTTVLVLEQ